MVPEREMAILRRTDKSMVRATCGVRFKDRSRSTDLMFMFGLNQLISSPWRTVFIVMFMC